MRSSAVSPLAASPRSHFSRPSFFKLWSRQSENDHLGNIDPLRTPLPPLAYSRLIEPLRVGKARGTTPPHPLRSQSPLSGSGALRLLTACYDGGLATARFLCKVHGSPGDLNARVQCRRVYGDAMGKLIALWRDKQIL